MATSSGNVGIGTDSPEQKFHVEGRGIFDGGISSDIITLRNDSGGFTFGNTTNLASLDLASTSNFRIRQGSSIPFYLTSAGNVGIGSTSPSDKLSVITDGNTTLEIGSAGTGLGARILSFDRVASVSKDLKLTANLITFNTGAGAGTERMRISSGGNTLIKTTTDNGTDALQVAGSGRFSGLLTVLANTGGNGVDIVGRSADGFAFLSFKNNANNAINGEIGISDAQNMLFYVGATPRLTIASTGASTFSSTVSATGFIVSSDRRLKNIVSRSGDMVTYTLKNDNTKQLHYGYIAQEVEKVLPTTVSTDDKGMKAVNYIEVLVKKVNDLEKEIAELKKHNK
jgi:hypothetical protein